MVEGRICACPEDKYFKERDTRCGIPDIECLPLPASFDRSRLKLDARYTYNGKKHVQHQ